MFPKKNRLSKTADVTLTTARGRTFFSQSFVIKYLAKPDTRQSLLTVIASNKVSKSAVVRNRLKRLLRSQIYSHLDKVKPGWYVFILKKSSVNVDPENLKRETEESLKKSKILTNV